MEDKINENIPYEVNENIEELEKKGWVTFDDSFYSDLCGRLASGEITREEAKKEYEEYTGVKLKPLH